MIRAILLMLATTGIAGAQPVSSADARRSVTEKAATRAIVADVPFLTTDDRQVIATLKDAVPHYGALALSPSEGLYVEWVNASGQYHTRASAAAAALAHCEANKAAASEPCVVVLEVVPEGDSGPLTLSAPATAMLYGAYDALPAPKAFAISETTGAFAFDAGEAGALIACAASERAPDDCRVVVID